MIRLLLPAALLLTPAVAAAQETRGSASAKLDTEFAQSDTNRDGYLSRAELEARMGKMRVAGGRSLDRTHATRMAGLFLARADADKDGRVSRAESRALMGKVFARYDLNGDGRVDGTESANARADAKARAGAR